MVPIVKLYAVTIFADIKKKSVLVQVKLKHASETKATLMEKREAYRGIATCATVLFFTIQETGRINTMYQVLCGTYILDPSKSSMFL